MEFADEVCQVPEIVGDALRMVSERARIGGIALDSDFDPRLPGLWADRRAVMQMLVNLLSNAVKFTLSGGRITVAAAMEESGGIAISIRDTGIGIPPGSVAAAFEPFTQLDSTLTRRHEGTGLGLYLTKAFIERHGGTIAIDSTPGSGTLVRLTFPPDRVVAQAAA
jgi:signal transduction histidine kinase